jgi:glucose-1-phosphate adenylyltransferase
MPLLGHTLRRLAAIGCEATAINLHHLGGQIRAGFGASFEGMPLTYSDEPKPLGTLGAFPPLREFFAPADLVLLINGDSLCRWPLDRLLRHHLEAGPAGTLLLASRPDPAAFGGGVAIDRAGSILAFRAGDPRGEPAAHRYVFAGAHVFQPRLVSGVKPGFADIVRDLYEPALLSGLRLDAVVTSRPWHDLGTPRRYLEAVLDWARGSRSPAKGALYRGPEGVLASAARIEGSVLEARVKIEDETSIEGSVVLSGVRIGRGSRLREVLVGPGVVLPPKTDLERCLVVAEGRSPEAASFRLAPLDPT